MGDQLGGPEYALLVPIYRATNPSGEVSLSAAAADVTPAKLVALLGRSVGCALAPRIHRTLSTPRRPADSRAVRSGLRPRVVGDAPGVVARSEADDPLKPGRTAHDACLASRDDDAVARWGPQMAATGGGRHHGLVDEQTVYAAVDAIDEALETALLASTEREQRWQLNQLRGLLLMLRLRDLSLEEALRRLIRLLQTPMAD
jgi:hypothetical protein